LNTGGAMRREIPRGNGEMFDLVLGVTVLFLFYLAIGYLGARLNERRAALRKVLR
jgi:hypothetical protein